MIQYWKGNCIYKIDEPLEPKEIDIEKYSEDDYCQSLNDCYGEVRLGSLVWDADYVLRELDPIAYRCGFSDFQEYETKYLCPICENQHDDYDEALWCCQQEIDEEDEEATIN